MELDNRKICKALIKGSNYLLKSLNYDNGVKFEDESSTTSGAWVTAESLEALLMSEVLPLASYSKIKPMIDFLVNCQNGDGSWNILADDRLVQKPSAIATGHCTYVLKLASVGGYLSSDEVKQAIDKGEHWLSSSKCCITKGGVTFWASEPVEKDVQIDFNANVGSRMEYIFSSYYAVMGLVNPEVFFVRNDVDVALLDRTVRFFKSQAEFFIGNFKSEMEQIDNISKFAKVSSTICRIICALDMLSVEVPNNITNGLNEVLLSCSKNPFMTTSIAIHTDQLKSYGTTYNNNTPFDMANALICTESNSQIIKEIIDKYIDNQDPEGYWYLNFSSAYTIKTWSTAEALIVLNRALKKYNEIELSEQKHQIETITRKVTKQFRRIRSLAIISSLFSMVLSVIDILLIIKWISVPENKDSFWGNLLSILIIPLVLWIIGVLCNIIKTTYNIIKNGKGDNNENE